MRRERVLYQDKVALGEQAWETYEGAIRTCLKLYENTQDPYYKTLAFHYAEKSKSGALTQNLSDYRAKSFGIIPDALLELETSLKIDRSYYQGQIQQERAKATIDSARLARYEDRLFKLNFSYDSLVEALEKQYPRYYQLKYQSDILSVDEVQKNLKPTMRP
jgi:hypothetical protein